jgi:SAM-dependent methyltransferase
VKINANWLTINSLGPYSHSNFIFQGKEFSHEGPLQGRENFLKKTAEKSLSEFQIKNGIERKNIRILEIGSFDGAIANHLFHKGYTNITTIESRKINIKRGKLLRKVLKRQDGVKHFNMNAEKFPKFMLLLKGKFDFIICFGLLHHVQNPHKVLSDISKMLKDNAKSELLLETVSIDDSSMDKNYLEAIEAKDILYRDGNIKVGFLGIKRESDYFPGSTTSNQITTVPSKNGLLLMLSDLSFEIKFDFAGWEKTVEKQQLMHRKFVQTTLILAMKTKSFRFDSSVAAADYEDSFCLSAINRAQLDTLMELQTIPHQLTSFIDEYCSKIHVKEGEREILKSIKYSPRPKLIFELAKVLLNEDRKTEAISILIDLVTKDFVEDWRTCYRSLYMLASVDSKKWLPYAKLCNMKFPKTTLNKMKDMYN